MYMYVQFVTVKLINIFNKFFQMAYNFTNPFTFPWSNSFGPNGFSTGTPRPQQLTPTTGFTHDMFQGTRFPALFPYGIPYQGANHGFSGEWSFPYSNSIQWFATTFHKTAQMELKFRLEKLGIFIMICSLQPAVQHQISVYQFQFQFQFQFKVII